MPSRVHSGYATTTRGCADFFDTSPLRWKSGLLCDSFRDWTCSPNVCYFQRVVNIAVLKRTLVDNDFLHSRPLTDNIDAWSEVVSRFSNLYAIDVVNFARKIGAGID